MFSMLPCRLFRTPTYRTRMERCETDGRAGRAGIGRDLRNGTEDDRA
ncbi:hypothetical protein NJ7G_1834 [Natrinema sp. J7-2]|nr:hypothetical protein NJ7G_1834 [Natrinema sp. J7-2]